MSTEPEAESIIGHPEGDVLGTRSEERAEVRAADDGAAPADLADVVEAVGDAPAGATVETEEVARVDGVDPADERRLPRWVVPAVAVFWGGFLGALGAAVHVWSS